MNKKLLTIAIALMIFAFVIAPAAAELPSENPFPRNPVWSTVWGFLSDLQAQIDNLAENSLHFGDYQRLDNYFTEDTEEYSAIAATDGIVTVSATFIGGYVRLVGEVDDQVMADSFGPGIQTITFPVKKDSTWWVKGPAINDGSFIVWTPLES